MEFGVYAIVDVSYVSKKYRTTKPRHITFVGKRRSSRLLASGFDLYTHSTASDLCSDRVPGTYTLNEQSGIDP